MNADRSAMGWVERKKWFGKEEARQKKKEPVKLTLSDIEDNELYSVMEVALVAKVHRSTVFKWLSVNDPDGAVIKPCDWKRRRHDGAIFVFGRAIKNLFIEN